MALTFFGSIADFYAPTLSVIRDALSQGTQSDPTTSNSPTGVQSNPNVVAGAGVNASPLGNDDNVKKYSKLKLNSVSTQRNRDILYPGKITNSFYNMTEAGERIYQPDVTDATGPYRAVVLSVHDAPSTDTVEGILRNVFSFPWQDKKKTVSARINELHHAAIPMPAQFGDDPGAHQFFISMCDTFTSIKPVSVKPGDIVLVDFKDRKNKKDGFLIEVITEADVQQTGEKTSAKQASQTGGKSKPGFYPKREGIPTPAPGFVGRGEGYQEGKCGGAIYPVANCKTGKIYEDESIPFYKTGYNNLKLHPEVFDNFVRMAKAIKEETGITIYSIGTYRTLKEQIDKKNLCKQNGKCSTDEFLYDGPNGTSGCEIYGTTGPGSSCPYGRVTKIGRTSGSRHQFGEAIDIGIVKTYTTKKRGKVTEPAIIGSGGKTGTITDLSNPNIGENDKIISKWLIANSFKFNFYNYFEESWHYSSDGY